MATNTPDLTGAQLVDQFRQNVALLNTFVNGADTQSVTVASGSYPTIAKLVKDNKLTLLGTPGTGLVRRAADGTWSASALTAADLPANVALPGYGAMVPPTGTSAQRSATPTPGMFRYNSTLGLHEGYTPAGWVPMNVSVLAVYHGFIGQGVGTSIIPNDNTPPLPTEGTALWSKTVTPNRNDSSMLIGFAATVDTSNNNHTLTLAIFRDTTLIGVANANVNTSGRPINIAIRVEDVPGVTTPVTYSCRMGADANTTWYIGRTANTTQGGTNKLGWSIMEVLS